MVEPIVKRRRQHTLKQTPFFVILYQDEEKSSATREDRSAKSALKLATEM
jgi:hypothetical protein